MRLIDADAFEKFIIDHFPYRPSEGECMAYEDVLRMLSDEYATPTIEVEPVATDTNVGSKWIPVTERLPEEWVAVLVWSWCGFHENRRMF